MSSPTRAPLRRSGLPTEPKTLIEMTMRSAKVRSPPTTIAPIDAASSAIPSASSSISSTEKFFGRAAATRRYSGRPPIAKISAKFADVIFAPIS